MSGGCVRKDGCLTEAACQIGRLTTGRFCLDEGNPRVDPAAAPASPASPDREGKQGLSSSRDHAPTADAACVAEATTLVSGEEAGWNEMSTAPSDSERELLVLVHACGMFRRDIVRWSDKHSCFAYANGDLCLYAVGWTDQMPPLPTPLNPLVPGEVKP
jgi:hypothetical protein